MEIELRNSLLVTTSALQVVVRVLAKHAQAQDPTFKQEVIDTLNARPIADAATAAETQKALSNLLQGI